MSLWQDRSAYWYIVMIKLQHFYQLKVNQLILSLPFLKSVNYVYMLWRDTQTYTVK